MVVVLVVGGGVSPLLNGGADALISLFVGVNMGVTDPTKTSIPSSITPGLSWFQLLSWKISPLNSSNATGRSTRAKHHSS